MKIVTARKVKRVCNTNVGHGVDISTTEIVLASTAVPVGEANGEIGEMAFWFFYRTVSLNSAQTRWAEEHARFRKQHLFRKVFEEEFSSMGISPLFSEGKGRKL